MIASIVELLYQARPCSRATEERFVTPGLVRIRHPRETRSELGDFTTIVNHLMPESTKSFLIVKVDLVKFC